MSCSLCHFVLEQTRAVPLLQCPRTHTTQRKKKRNDSVANSVNDSVHRFHPTVEYYSLLFLQQAKKALNLEDNPFLPTNDPQSDALPGNKGGSGDVAEKRE